MKPYPALLLFLFFILSACGSSENIETPSRMYIENVNREAGTNEDPVFPEKYKDERVDPYKQ